MHLIYMMLQARVRDWAHLRPGIRTRMIGWENRRDWSHHRTDTLVQLLVFGRVDGLFERGASVSTEVGVDGDARVLVEVMVMVGRCFGYGADEAWRVHVEVGVRGRKNGVGRANDGADLLGSGSHGSVVGEELV